MAAALALSDLDGYAPLDLREPPGAFTQWRIRLLASTPQACLRALDRSGIAVAPAPPRIAPDGCGYPDGVTPRPGALSLGGSPTMRCPLAAAFAAWERHVVSPAARARLGGARVVGVRHLGVYACRDIAGRSGRRSQHAAANAVDVSGFELSDGRVLTLAEHWRDPGQAGRFLHDVRDGGCGLFAGVLSPDYDAAHRDHFHFDLGPFDVCR